MTISMPPIGKNMPDACEHKQRIQRIDPIRELKDGRDTTRNVTRWDRYLAGSEAEQGGSFGTALSTHGKSAAWAAFARETYSKLYDSGVTTSDLPVDERPMGSDWVEQLHESCEALPEWRALRDRARRDSWACGIAAGEAMNVLAQNVKPPETDPQSIQDEHDLVKEMMEETGKTSAKHLRRLAALKRQVQDANEEHARATGMLAAKAASIRSALRGAAQKAQETIDEYDTAMGALGAGDGAGIASRVSAPPAQVRSALARNAKLRRILKRAGRMKSAAIAKQRTKARPGAEELCDVTSGRDIQRLVPAELLNLATPETEALLYCKLIEGSALTYELRGREHRSEGPIIMLVDESGSMSGEPDEWAKSVAMAMMEIAARQNRPFAYVHFDSQVSRVDEVPTPKSLSLQQLEELATYFHGGGTSIGVALAHGAKMLEDALKTRDKPWKRADIVLVTDGISYDYEHQTKAINRLRAAGAHLYTFFIGCSPGGPVADMADEKLEITHQDIKANDPGKLGTIFSI